MKYDDLALEVEFRVQAMIKSWVNLLTQKETLFFALFNEKSLKMKGDEIDEDMIMSSSRWRNHYQISIFLSALSKIWGFDLRTSWNMD